MSDIYIVRSIDGDKAICEHKTDHAEVEFVLGDLVAVAEFGEPIYPYLKSIDTVCNAPDSDLWHTLIEADNYHALQLLEYLYAGKVDCIYIDVLRSALIQCNDGVRAVRPLDIWVLARRLSFGSRFFFLEIGNGGAVGCIPY